MFVEIRNLKEGDKFRWNDYDCEIVKYENLPDKLKDAFGVFSVFDDVYFRASGYRNALDGTEYDGLRPNEMVEITSVASQNTPKNNDGRAVCFWCPNTNTQKRGGGMYDVCPKCGR